MSCNLMMYKESICEGKGSETLNDCPKAVGTFHPKAETEHTAARHSENMQDWYYVG